MANGKILTLLSANDENCSELMYDENEKNNIEVIELEKLNEELKTLQVLMEPYNYKNTEIVGSVMTNDYPVKPKKSLIVTVAFVTGFIMSIFFVFFLEFIRNEKKHQLQ